MNQRNLKSKNSKQGKILVLVYGCVLSTLYFNSKIQDPFNAPKMWIIFLVAAWLSGHLLVNRKVLFSEFYLRISSIIILVFFICLIVSALFTDIKYTALFGENQRRNGVVTYLSLSIIFLSSTIFINKNNITKIVKAGFVTGLFLAGYGLMQTYGHDFIKWNNEYNAVISTVGNPNFAAAIMAIMAVIVFGFVLDGSNRLILRVASFFLFTLLLWVIIRSNARQGLVTLLLAVSIQLCVYLLYKNIRIGKIVFLLTGAGSLLAILGMLQIGPLEKFLYKGSVTVRGYYWRAGLEMLYSHPLTGIGIDRYGAYFKEYRDVGYPLKYGFDITSTNAHNVPIQFFATGGFFLGISYLFLILFTLYRGVVAIQKSDDLNRVTVVSIFCGWVAFESQSIISIDNIGISTWGWLLGGSLIALSLDQKIDVINSKDYFNTRRIVKINLVQPIVSGLFTVIALCTCYFLYQGENNMIQVRYNYDPNSSIQSPVLKDLAVKTSKTPLIEPFYSLQSAQYLFVTGDISGGWTILNELLRKDPRNPDYLNSAAYYYEKSFDYLSAIKIRKQIEKYDPWNAKNIYLLSQNYKSLKQYDNAVAVLNKLLLFAEDTPEGKAALSELAYFDNQKNNAK